MADIHNRVKGIFVLTITPGDMRTKHLCRDKINKTDKKENYNIILFSNEASLSPDSQIDE